MSRRRDRLISKPTLAVIKGAVAELCTHSIMTNLMEQYGFADGPLMSFDGNKLDRAGAYLDRADWSDVRTVKGLLELITHIFKDLTSRGVSIPDGRTAVSTDDRANRIIKALAERERIYWTGEGFDLSSLDASAMLVHASQSIQRFGLAEVNQEARRILLNVESDPGDAITSAKSLLESVCRHILADFGEKRSPTANLGDLMRAVMERLSLLPEQVSEKRRGAGAAKKVLRSIQATVQGLAELRNLYGDPHGKGPGYRGLESRHARLAATLSGAVAVFLAETHERRMRSRTP